MMNKKLFFYQLCDSNFPTGAFSHSFGFETLLYQQKIKEASDFEKWLYDYLFYNLAYNDALAARLVYEGLQSKLYEKVEEISIFLQAATLSREVREANMKMGKQFLKTLIQIFPDFSNLAAYNTAQEKKKFPSHPAIIFAIASYDAEIVLEEMLEGFLWNNLVSLVQNAIRGIPLGQVQGQKILSAFHEKINECQAIVLQLPEEVLGSMAPGLELAQMQHEDLFARNFMS